MFLLFNMYSSKVHKITNFRIFDMCDVAQFQTQSKKRFQMKFKIHFQCKEQMKSFKIYD